MVGPGVVRGPQPGERLLVLPLDLSSGLYDLSSWDDCEWVGPVEGEWDATEWDTSEFGAATPVGGLYDLAAYDDALWG